MLSFSGAMASQHQAHESDTSSANAEVAIVGNEHLVALQRVSFFGLSCNPIIPLLLSELTLLHRMTSALLVETTSRLMTSLIDTTEMSLHKIWNVAVSSTANGHNQVKKVNE